MGFGIRVQRLWKINLEGCSGPQRKSIIQGSKHTFSTNLGGVPFQALCLGVSDKGSGKRLKAWVSSNGSEGMENVIWQAALGIHRKCIIQGSKCSV